MDNYIGIDISKTSMEVYIPKNRLSISVENSKEGLKKLYSKLKKIYKREKDKIIFIYEATGSYSTLFEHYCHDKQIRCYKVDAAQSASFARTTKNRNKTDKTDAMMLAQMYVVAKKEDIKVPPKNEKAARMRALIKYYQTLTKEQTRVKNYLEASQHNLEERFIINRVKKRLQQIAAEREEILYKLITLIETDENYKKIYENIQSITGIGAQSAVILLYLFIRYPNASRQHITALCGLDPIERQSGTSVHKKAKISKQGITLVRGTLFMPTLVAIRTNPEMKYFYERLLQKGKPKPLALIAVMRKIILLAHSLYKNNQTYDPQRYLKYIAQNEKTLV